MANSTQSPSTQGDTTDGSSNEVGPLSVLPVVISLLAVVAIAIAACVFYRNRQRQRAELLARQLRVTERRIDVAGSVWDKSRDVVQKTTLYYPPADVRASASEPSVVTRTVPGSTRPHYVIRAFQPRLVPLSSSNKAREERMSVVNSSVCSCDYGVEVCSMCKEEPGEKQTCRDASNGSLAVELGTVPSLGSVDQAASPPQREVPQSEKVVIRRSKSDTAATAAETAPVRRSLQVESVLLMEREPQETPTRQVLKWMERSAAAKPQTVPSQPLPPASLSLTPYPETEEYTSTIITSTNEQEPPPNTPASRSLATESEVAPPEKALSYISEDTQSEKWV